MIKGGGSIERVLIVESNKSNFSVVDRKRNIEDGRPDGGVSRKMISDEIRCRTVPQIFSQMGYEWGITPVIKDFTEILEPANPHKHWVCK